MAFLLNLVVACLAAFGLSVLLGAAVVWLENREAPARSVPSREVSAASNHNPRLFSAHVRASGYPTVTGDAERNRNVA